MLPEHGKNILSHLLSLFAHELLYAVKAIFSYFHTAQNSLLEISHQLARFQFSAFHFFEGIFNLHVSNFTQSHLICSPCLDFAAKCSCRYRVRLAASVQRLPDPRILGRNRADERCGSRTDGRADGGA